MSQLFAILKSGPAFTSLHGADVVDPDGAVCRVLNETQVETADESFSTLTVRGENGRVDTVQADVCRAYCEVSGDFPDADRPELTAYERNR